MPAHQCSWLDGERRSYVQCEAVAERGRPYCAAHSLRVLESAPRPTFVKVAQPKPAKVAKTEGPTAPKARKQIVPGTGGYHTAPDMTGQRFGRLVVLARAGVGSKGAASWACLCDCGNEAKVLGGNLRSGSSTQCVACGRKAQAETQALRRKPPKERKIRAAHIAPSLVGQRFGQLVVESRAGVSTNKLALWCCRCDCGEARTASGCDLRAGRVSRCNACAGTARIATIKAVYAARRAAGVAGYRPARLGDLVGQRFGSLLVVARAENDGVGRTRWSCVCDCGNTCPVGATRLRSGATTRCLSCTRKASWVVLKAAAHAAGAEAQA